MSLGAGRWTMFRGERMAYKMIQVGTGGFGRAWCGWFLPPNVKDGLVEVVAAVDIDPAALANAKENLALRDDQRYTDARKAFDENRADFCSIVVPPSAHEKIVDLALEHDMHILSEKPIADTSDTFRCIGSLIPRYCTVGSPDV